MAIDSKGIRNLLHWAVQNGVSDIHFRKGDVPALRIKGDLIKIKGHPYSEQDMLNVCASLLAKRELSPDFLGGGELDGSFELPEVARFRFNIFKFDERLGAVLRMIPLKVPNFEDLLFPDVMRKIATIDRGFILVTGATGSGKSTTLAAIVDYINTTRSGHIVTIEDPIEFIHAPKKCRITQREVGRDTATFSSGLRSVLRQDPNIILIGEMRDAESVDIALKAAETGHTVYSTIHTADATRTIGRLVAMFPPEEQSLVRLRLADCLKATISQRLIKKKDGQGRIAAQEIMITNTAIQECIADPARTGEILKFIENAASLLGSQTFDQDLIRLYQNGTISYDTAKRAAASASDFEHKLRFETSGGGTTSGAIPSPSARKHKEAGMAAEGPEDEVSASEIILEHATGKSWGR